MKDVEVIKAHNTLSPRARTNFEKRLRVAAYCRVSTDTEDQLNSYKSQVKYYTELIKSKPEWSLAGIYADEAITGTQVKKREDFQRLINDCMNGDVDMVITKSISRFARNTLDTLKYVRMLKDKGVAVFFEEENINTLTMDGELLLVILSSVAQQEVENISANVKKGLKMKMQRGELVGFQGCLGYDYNPADKTITINEEEAAVVRYIFQRYTEGAGGSVIAKELENLGYKTKRGSPKWADSTVIGIIKNEKYKGDILLGKTFTVDPISKRRLYNFGEEDQFYIREHHEPIISEEVFEAAQEILRRRAKPRSLNVDGKREKFSRKYAFSCMIECGFCGGTLTRRSNGIHLTDDAFPFIQNFFRHGSLVPGRHGCYIRIDFQETGGKAVLRAFPAKQRGEHTGLGGADNGAVRIGQEDILVVRLAGVFEGGTTEQAKKIAFVRTVVAVEVGEQAVYFVIVDEYATGIVAQSGHKSLDGGVDHHVTLSLRQFHFFRQ